MQACFAHGMESGPWGRKITALAAGAKSARLCPIMESTVHARYIGVRSARQDRGDGVLQLG